MTLPSFLRFLIHEETAKKATTATAAVKATGSAMARARLLWLSPLPDEDDAEPPPASGGDWDAAKERADEGGGGDGGGGDGGGGGM